MADFKALRVYRSSVELTIEIYETTARFPRSERQGIAQQLRRAACSVGANLAEGSGRSTSKDLARFVDVAQGSAHEVEHFLLLSNRLGYLDEEALVALGSKVTAIQQMLSGLRSRLRSKPTNPG